jgi:ectoine hydroxylase-related dioxygenase (phytanoyl-CoA dioxygenase family)
VGAYAHDYHRDGFAVISGLFESAEVESWRAEAARLFADANVMTLDNQRTVTRNVIDGGKVVDRLDPVIDLSPVLADLARDPRITTLAGELLGEPALLLKDKLVFKGPSVHGYELHQDYTAWQEVPVPAESIISIMVALDGANQENGGVEFYPGLHQRHLVDDMPEDIFSSTGCVVDEAHVVGVASVLAEAQAGDIVPIHCLAPHRSAPNRTRGYRRALFLTYSGQRWGDQYDAYYENFRGYRRASIATKSL